MQELRPGPYRWTARHPSWKPGARPESVGDWPQLVGCVAVDLGEEVVFVDPLVPEALWPRRDERVAGRGVHARETVASHRRSAKEVLERYGGSTDPPAGVVPVAVPARETEYWLPAFGALVVGDRVIGRRRGGLRLCPDSWLRGGGGPGPRAGPPPPPPPPPRPAAPAAFPPPRPPAPRRRGGGGPRGACG